MLGLGREKINLARKREDTSKIKETMENGLVKAMTGEYVGFNTANSAWRSRVGKAATGFDL